MAVAAALSGSSLLDSDLAPHRALAAVARGCPTPAAVARASIALGAARHRYLTEARGAVIHLDLRQIANDPVLLAALDAEDLRSALVEANRQLVRHVVQIRVLRGPRVLVAANARSFDVGGSGVELRGRNGRRLGRLEITVQDVIGFIKLIHKVDHADVVVRSGGDQVRTSLHGAATVALPRLGCTQIGAHTYVVRSFNETSFTGEPLTIWVLTVAQPGPTG